ncbi:MAG: DUF1513 domain-containing protein [Rhodospirillaceae bacterium]
MLDRRQFLIVGGAALLAAPHATAQTARQPRLYASCGSDGEGRFFAAGFDPTGTLLFSIPIPERGHDIAFHPGRAEAVVFARRPGMTMHVIDTAAGGIARVAEAAPGRHYYGHGVFTPDGALLYVTENDFDEGTGLIGVYDPNGGYRRVGEFPSGGIGPHQLRLMPDGRTLAVANGGILTHPDTGRAKLNLERMQPNLAVVDPVEGRALWSATLPRPLHKLSIRHLDVNRSGILAIAMQYEGDVRDRVPLIALAEVGSPFRYVKAPADIDRRMRQYTGSTVFDSSGDYLAVSSPRGSVIGLWDARTGGFLRDLPAPDASGLAPTGERGGFLLTGGDGAIRTVAADRPEVAGLRGADRAIRWDNHLAASPLPQNA